MPDADAPASSSAPGLPRPGWPVLVAGLLGALFVFAPQGPGGAEALGRFLSEGPQDGTWEIRSFQGTRRLVVLCDPDDDRCRCVGFVGQDGDDGGCSLDRVVSRERVAKALVPGCHRLFFVNYEVAEVRDVSTLEGTRRLFVWRPRARGRGETARRVWLDPPGERVLRLEDCAAGGEVIREVYRVGDAPVDVRAALERDGATRVCLECDGVQCRNPQSLAAVEREAPFAVLGPTWLPRGFGLKQAAFRCQEEGGGIACFVYGDGLATVALFMGPLENVRRFEGRFGEAGCVPGDPTRGCADGNACSKTCRARRRYDPRRTVLRVDALHGLSVVLLGQNELPGEDYLRILEGLEPTSR